jgi:hypothetical protein
MSRKLSLLVLSGFLCAAAGYLVLLAPDNPFTNLFRSEIAVASDDPQIVIGPYPVEKDFSILRQQQITTIVSLLNPQLPYENTLLEGEKMLAAKHGMQVLNFPLTSILGQRMGKAYETNALAAADAIANAKGKVYVHCYLGVHRAKYVTDLVAQKKQVRTVEYSERKGERSETARLLDQAEAKYNNQQYQKALDILSQLEQTSPAARLLRAWSLYKLRNITEARAQFTAVLNALGAQEASKKADALTGLGYCDLSDNDLAQAQERFAEVLKLAPDDRAALMGLSVTHYRQQAFSNATQYLQALVKIDPENQEAKDLLTKIDKAQKSGTVASPK